MSSEDPTDEDLMAHADGELPAGAAEAVEAAAARDPGIAARLAEFHRSARLVKAALPVEEVPESLRRAVDAAIERSSAPSAASNVVALNRRAARSPADATRWAMPAAAAVLAVIAGVGGYLTGRETAPLTVANGPATAGGLQPAIVAALDRLPSGRTARTDAGEIRLLQSFRTGSGTLCREFSDVEGAHTIACRRDNGWRAELRVAGDPGAPGAYAPASGDDDVTAAWLSGASAGPALDPVAEAGALSER